MKTSIFFCSLVVLVFAAMVIRQVLVAQDGNRLAQAFNRVDVDRDGKLSKDDVERFAQLKKRLEGADRDGDGFVSESEFRTQLMGGFQRLHLSSGDVLAGESLREVQAGSSTRRYQLHVPASYDPAKPTPVVIAFHGGGGNPQSMIRLSGLNSKSDDAGFIVAYPYGSGRNPDRQLTFNGGGCCGYAKNKDIDDIGFVAAVLDDLEASANIDSDRIYATGISNGAIMSYYVASELSERIAAIAPVAGPMMTDECHPTEPVSIIHFHGTGDELAPFGGGRGKGSPGVPAFMRPEFRSVMHSIQNWVSANGCTTEPQVRQLPDAADDGMRVTQKVWSRGTGGAEVVLYEIENGGHTWPGRKPVSDILGDATMDISANDLMWEFFAKHPKPKR